MEGKDIISKPKRQTLHELDGLRGVGALVVLMNHLMLCFFSAPWGEVCSAWFEHLPKVVKYCALTVCTFPFNGGLAVYVFWVMSSYVLSFAFYSREESVRNDYLKLATFRRYPRLMIPVLFSVMLSFVLMKVGGYGALHEMETTKWLGDKFLFEPSYKGALYEGAIGGLFNFGGDTFNEVLWTMEKEMYGSLALFVYLFIFPRKLWLIDTVLLTVCVWFRIDYLTCFIIGMLLLKYKEELSCLMNQKWVQRLLLPLLVMCILSIIKYSALLPFQSSFIVVAVIYSPFLCKLFSSLPKFLATLSFSLYLVHIPIMCSVGAYSYVLCYQIMGKGGAVIAMIVTTVIFSFFIAWLLHMLCDKYLLKMVNAQIGKLLKISFRER